MKKSYGSRIVVCALAAFASLSTLAQDRDVGSGVATTSAASAKAADKSLQKIVRRALSRTKGLSVVNVLVRARSGVITLQGTVPESGQIDLAQKIAQGVPGVTSVTNHLTVRRNGP